MEERESLFDFLLKWGAISGNHTWQDAQVWAAVNELLDNLGVQLEQDKEKGLLLPE